MALDLAAVVRAEQEADKLQEEARQDHTKAIAEALAERERALRDLYVPPLPVHVKPIEARTEQLRAAAEKNRERVIGLILEELHAA